MFFKPSFYAIVGSTTLHVSTTYPSFTCWNQKYTSIDHLLYIFFYPYTFSWAHTKISYLIHVLFVLVFLFIHLCNKQGNSPNKISCRSDYLYLYFHHVGLISRALVSLYVNLSSLISNHSLISLLVFFHAISLSLLYDPNASIYNITNCWIWSVKPRVWKDFPTITLHVRVNLDLGMSQWWFRYMDSCSPPWYCM